MLSSSGHLNLKNLNVQNVPWALTTIPGGSMDNKKTGITATHVISRLNQFQKDVLMHSLLS